MLTTKDVQQVLPKSSVRNYFSSLRKAVEAAGLEMSENNDHLDAVRRVLSDDELFGSIRVLDFRGLRHAPINEQGVVYLFGMR